MSEDDFDSSTEADIKRPLQAIGGLCTLLFLFTVMALIWVPAGYNPVVLKMLLTELTMMTFIGILTS